MGGDAEADGKVVGSLGERGYLKARREEKKRDGDGFRGEKVVVCLGKKN